MPTTKTQIAAVLTDEEYQAVAKKAEKAKLSIGNLIRVNLGLAPLKQGRPKNPAPPSR